MKLLNLRTILLFSTSSYSSQSVPLPFFPNRCKILGLLHFSTYSHHPSSHSSSHSSSRRQEEESRNVRVSVWWDFENCSLPAGANVFKVAHSITAAIRGNGIKGPIQITAFGDVLQLSRSNQEALSATGINLAHIPHGGKNSADRSLLVDLMYWVSQNPPPAHIFLISGDRDFASILHRLRMSNYNVLLASPESAPSVLCSASSIMWHWCALVRGENLSGKHFNQPPDGPYNSWYGHYKVALEDPYSCLEQPTPLHVEETPESGSDSKVRSLPKELPEPASDVKPRPVPKAVMKQIRNILSLNPKGMSINDLRSELGKNNINLEKDLYGYRKFSRFLLGMPHILKVRFGSDGKYFVYGHTARVPEPATQITSPVDNDGAQESSVTSKSSGQSSASPKPLNGDSRSAIHESTLRSHELNMLEPPTERLKGLPLNVVDGDTTTTAAPKFHASPLEKQNTAPEGGFFSNFWRKWVVQDERDSDNVHSIEIRSSTSVDRSESEGKFAESTSPSTNPVPSASWTSPGGEFVPDGKNIKRFQTFVDESSEGRGLLNRIINWFRFWGGSKPLETISGHSDEKLNCSSSHGIKLELFSRESFWDDMESFLDTPKGAGIVSQSRNREQMVHGLQREGPLILRSLCERDILHFVDILILEKKWVKESPSETFPYKLSRPVGENSFGASSSNGLRSLFLGNRLQPELQKQTEHDEPKEHQGRSHDSDPQPVTSRKRSSKSRDEILSDCQRLVADLLKENPEGFQMGGFGKLFFDKYGYPLVYQKLGYPKLGSLLQIMPGVRIEGHYVIPAACAPKDPSLEDSLPNILRVNDVGKAANSDSELSDSRSKDDLESPWEELGPVESSNPNRCEAEKVLDKRAKTHESQFDYECALSDDEEFTDSEDDSPPTTSGVGQKPGINEEDSSLLQILDSWYSNKEDKSTKDCPDVVSGMVNCSKNGLKVSRVSGVGLRPETGVISSGRKQKPSRSYTFVSDEVGDTRDKLIDGILGSLKKSGEARMET